MNDTSVSSAGSAHLTTRWLLLITEVPSKPDYLRVKLRRRVQRLGAVGLKGAVYLLPDSVGGNANFSGLRREIVADGGQATICRARLIEGMSDQQVVALFNAERQAEYAELLVDCTDLERRWQEGAAGSDRGSLIAERGRCFSRLEEILARDFFDTPHREEVMLAIERLATLSS